MKEVALREYRAGFSGLSIPLGKGFRYRIGAMRGRQVQVGTEMQVADQGVLSVSSKRVVFLGSRKTMEMPLSKLVNITLFTDGVQLHMSNRVNAPLFLVGNMAQVVGAAVAKAVERVDP